MRLEVDWNYLKNYVFLQIKVYNIKLIRNIKYLNKF
jgi:hypothetical protein